MIQNFKAKNLGYSWPEFTDFWICLIVAALWMSLERLIHKLSFGFFVRLAREGEDTTLRTQRAQKSVKNLYKLSYYFPIAIFGYYVLRDSPVLTPELGGSGSFYN
jgi:hypothetical protein